MVDSGPEKQEPSPQFEELHSPIPRDSEVSSNGAPKRTQQAELAREVIRESATKGQQKNEPDAEVTGFGSFSYGGNRELLPPNIKTCTRRYYHLFDDPAKVRFADISNQSFLSSLSDKQARPLRELLELVELDQNSMESMNAASPGIPIDDKDKLLQMLLSPGAMVATLEKTTDETGENWDQRKIVGFSLVLTDPSTYDAIPARLLEPKHAEDGSLKTPYRIIRIFVDQDEIAYLPKGEAIDSLISHTQNEIARGTPMIAMALVGPADTLDQSWLQAKKALTARRFGPADLPDEERIVKTTFTSHPSGTNPELEFEWWTNPPERFEDKHAATLRAERHGIQESWVRTRLSWPLSRLAGKNLNIACFTNNDDGYHLARMMKSNKVLAVQLARGQEKLKTSNLTRTSFSEYEESNGPSFDGMFAGSIIPDLLLSKESEANAIVLRDFLGVQAERLEDNGVLLIRDTVGPENNRVVYLALRNDDEKMRSPENSPEQFSALHCSTADLFENFMQSVVTKGKNPALQDDIDRDYQVDDKTPQFTHFRTSLRTAWEFLLKEQYRHDWEKESVRPFTAFKKSELLASIKDAGLDENWTEHEQSDWIVRNRFMRKAVIRDIETGEQVPYPSTSCIVSATKRRLGNKMVGTPVPAHSQEPFFVVKSYSSPDFKGTREILEHNPHTENPITMTHDALVWFRDKGEIHMRLRTDFPRPNITGERIDGSTHSGYMTAEQTSKFTDFPVYSSAADIREQTDALVRERAGTQAKILSYSEPSYFCSSPGTFKEVLASQAVEIEPDYSQVVLSPELSGFTSAGFIRTMPVRQFIRTAHRGGAESSRLEIAIYDLLQKIGESPDMWHGENLDLPIRAVSPHVESARELLDQASELRQSTLTSQVEQAPSFLGIRTERFYETDRSGIVLNKSGERVFVDPENSQPLIATTNQELDLSLVSEENLAFRDIARADLKPNTGFSNETVTVLLLRRVIGANGTPEYQVGLEYREDMPALDETFGTTHLLTLPAFRIPHQYEEDPYGRTLPGNNLAGKLSGDFLLRRYVLSRLYEQFKIQVADLDTSGDRSDVKEPISHTARLGSKYFTSPGALSEAVHPLFAEVEEESPDSPERLHWVPLADLLEHADQIRCGHLRLSVYRAAHAAGLLYR